MTNATLIKKATTKATKDKNNKILLKVDLLKKVGKFIPHSTKLELQEYIKC